jgi:hypothetical protein
MLLGLTILIMLIVAYANSREGIFTSVNMLVNVVVAGIVTFNFWEPFSTAADGFVRGTFLDGYQDLFLMILLFCAVMGLMRAATNNLATTQIEFPALAQQLGSAAIGLVTGYLVSGFLVCVLETLPWHQNFMGFEPRARTESPFRSYFPADRVWLGLMRHAGAFPFAGSADEQTADSAYQRYATFDRSGTFELRYLRYRRYPDTSGPLPYQGELDSELYPRQ